MMSVGAVSSSIFGLGHPKISLLCRPNPNPIIGSRRRRRRGRSRDNYCKVRAALVVDTARPSSSSVVVVVPNNSNSNYGNTKNASANSSRQQQLLQIDDLKAEARALSRASNATIYSPQHISTKYGSRPFKVSEWDGSLKLDTTNLPTVYVCMYVCILRKKER